MDNNTLRIRVSLRLGSNLCRPHTCLCGSKVNGKGLHGSSCQKSLGILPRHFELNDIISRSLSSIKIPTKLEPSGLLRNDGKRADGVTLTPWSKGQLLVWDTTCVDTFADSYISKTFREAGKLADKASLDKHEHYKNVKSDNYIFQPFAVETMGAWSTDSIKFIDAIGSKLQEISGEKRSKFYLIPKISLAIQRENALCIMGTIPPSSSLDEIVYL